MPYISFPVLLHWFDFLGDGESSGEVRHILALSSVLGSKHSVFIKEVICRTFVNGFFQTEEIPLYSSFSETC